MDAKEIILVYGPTASGKTALACELAASLGGEIVSIDSLQVYRGMDIGTAKPDAVTRQQTPHHLVDILDPHEPLDAQSFADKARQAIDAIISRGRVPILAGGSGLYFTATLQGFFKSPPGDPGLRARLQEQAGREGAGSLFRRLEAVDPDSARLIHPNNVHRIIRALEVYELTGAPFSLGKQQARQSADYVIRENHFLNPERDKLYQAIEERTRKMYGHGLVEETVALRSKYGEVKPLSSIGYREACEVIDGKLTTPQALLATAQATRNYAKRQVTWFSKQMKYQGVDARETPRFRSGGPLADVKAEKEKKDLLK